VLIVIEVMILKFIFEHKYFMTIKIYKIKSRKFIDNRFKTPNQSKPYSPEPKTFSHTTITLRLILVELDTTKAKPIVVTKAIKASAPSAPP